MCRTAVSAWMATNARKSSTSKRARAVSLTCHTTTAAISIGFPSESFTLVVAVSWFLIRVEIRTRLLNGFTHRSPGCRSVPE
jgi:hypothetical protein